MWLINMGLKALVFSIFTGLVFFSINYIIGKATLYIPSGSSFNLLLAFGVFEALSLYISIVAVGFGIRQVLNFIKS